MKRINELILLFLLAGLLSCSTQNSSVDLTEINQDEVHLELVGNSNYEFNQNGETSFIEGVELVQQFDDKLLVKVDVVQLDLKSAKRILRSKGFKVIKQYGSSHTNSEKQLSSRNDIERGIQIPEITFPNIFKALVVFYR